MPPPHRPASLCNSCGQISALPGSLNCAECAARGAPALVELVVQVECAACGGTGASRSQAGEHDWRSALGMPARQCFDCGGTGSVSESQRRSQEILQGRELEPAAVDPRALEPCPACDGDGCRFCGGGGVLPAAKASAIRDLLA